MGESGYIYAIGAAGTSHVKIGSTRRDVQGRLRVLQVGHPFRLHMLASVAVETNLRRIERQIHTFLAEERQRGEWFDISMDVATLEALIVRAVQFLQASDARAEEERIAEETHRQVCVRDQTLGGRLHYAREACNMSQQELAERSGLRFQNISRLETDRREHVRSDTLRRLAEALGCSTDYLVGLTDNPTPPKRPRSRTAAPVS
jgi:DNA-binding Xre family transcriptional regulator